MNGSPEKDYPLFHPKDLSLEAVRGIASLSVLAWHFLIAFHFDLLFAPNLGFIGSPFYGLVHGTAAVGVFFLLSGFVLTRLYFETGDYRILLIGALKRWFRLTPLILFSVILSWCFYRFDLYSYASAALLNNSFWLSNGGGIVAPPAHASFGTALHEGLFGALFSGDNSFNSNLWTMQFEMYGSLLAFSFAGCLNFCRGNKIVLFFVVLLFFVATSFVDLRYNAFLAGALLAAFAPRVSTIKPSMAWLFILLGLLCLGYRAPIGFYSFMMPFDFTPETLYTLFSILGGALIVLACTGCDKINKALQNPVSRFLGQISFPLYLLHITFICSIGSSVLVWLRPDSRPDYLIAVFVVGIVLVATLLIASWALSVIDRLWMSRLNTVFAKASGFLFNHNIRGIRRVREFAQPDVL